MSVERDLAARLAGGAPRELWSPDLELGGDAPRRVEPGLRRA